MKAREILSTLFIIVVSFCASATDPDEQYLNYLGINYTYVNTKGGQSVLVYILDDVSAAQKAQWLSDCLNDFPNAIILGEATPTYNCHNYTWYMTEGHSTSRYWMDPVKPYTHSANVSKFWTNDAFVETTGSVYDKIVYYYSNDISDTEISHSAVVSSVPGYYESKWGHFPLIRHLPDSLPPEYGTTKRYFKPITPTPVYGVITCSNGAGTIGVNVAASYSTDVTNYILSYTTNIEYIIETGKGDDAVDLGYAVINSQNELSMNVTFTHASRYVMYIRYYNKYNELLAQYWFEPLVM